MKHLDLFSGIGGFSLGLQQAGGFETVAFCEIDKYCQKVLKSHWDIHIFDDIKELSLDHIKNLGSIDIITAGFPCQDVSIAGKRTGLRGSRSGLFFHLARIIGDVRPKWFIIENVLGLLSSNKGRDFRHILYQMDEFGYCVSWRVLDSQYFGLAQRRKRVFLVGSLGDTSSSKVLFDKSSHSGYTEKGSTEGFQTSVTSDGSSYWDGGQLSDTLDSSMLSKGQMLPEKRRFPVIIDAFDVRNLKLNGNISGTLQAKNSGGYSLNFQNPILINKKLRRLTPLECERLQGFTDNFTIMCSDTQRYRQLGNAVSVPVIKWIGERIIWAENPYFSP